jgi:hypothetical protein
MRRLFLIQQYLGCSNFCVGNFCDVLFWWRRVNRWCIGSGWTVLFDLFRLWLGGLWERGLVGISHSL